MKLLFVNSVCGTGSTGRIITDLVSVAEQKGYQCNVAYGIGTACRILPSKTYKISGRFRYYFNNLISKVSGITGGGAFLSTAALIRYIKEIKPDIIHLHNLHGYYLNVFSLFKFLSKAGIPVMWTLHDCWAFTGNCSHYSFAGCEKWKEECGDCPQLRMYPQSYFLDFTGYLFRLKKKRFTAVRDMVLTTPSEWLKREVEQSFLGTYPCHAIHNGVDTQQFHICESTFKQENDLQDKKLIVGVANAWEKRKGLEDFFRLSECLPDDYIIVLVGLSAGQCAALPPKIIGIERTNSLEQLVDIYNAADVFVNPSYEETFGMVTAEAMLCGTPVIVYDRTAVPEIVSEPYGRIIPAGDVHAVAEAVLKPFSCTSEQVRASVLICRKGNMANAYLDLYEGLVHHQ